jgi:hypothetical protein
VPLLTWNDTLPGRPRRVLVAGTSGAGKTTNEDTTWSWSDSEVAAR